MLDTIRVKYPIAVDHEDLEYWTCRTTKTMEGIRELTCPRK